MLSFRNPKPSSRPCIRVWSGVLADGVLTVAPGCMVRELDSGKLVRLPSKRVGLRKGARVVIQAVDLSDPGEVASVVVRGLGGEVELTHGQCGDGPVWVMPVAGKAKRR